MSDENFYLLVVDDATVPLEFDGLSVQLHSMLLNAGYRVPCLYPQFEPGAEEARTQWWKDAMAQARIVQLDYGFMPGKRRHVFRVSPRPSSL